VNLIVGEDDDLIAWLEDRIPGAKFYEATTIGVSHGEEIGAAFAFFNCRRECGMPVDVEMAAAVDYPQSIRPCTLSVVMSYPFTQLCVGRVTAQTREDNTRCIRALKRMGFQHEGTRRNANLDGSSNLEFGMTHSEYFEGRLAPRSKQC